MKKYLLFITICFSLLGCKPTDSATPLPRSPADTSGSPVTPPPNGTPTPPAPTPAPTPTPSPETYSTYEALPWEKTSENRKWSVFLFQQIEDNSNVYFKGAKDITSFCPHYYSLNNKEQTEFWAELLSTMSKYESNFNPLNRFKEPGGQIDPITKMAVYSEGLLQLSYQDTQWMPECKFNWSKDKLLAVTDPNRTILSPYNNLECAVLIMKRQLTKYNQIAVSTNAYWSVIKTDSQYNKLSQIKTATQNLSYCK